MQADDDSRSPLPASSYSRARAIGDGTFGAVCVAYDDITGDEVAAKAFDDADDGTVSTETFREISSLRLLVGAPGVVRLLDVAYSLSGLPAVVAILPLEACCLADALETALTPKSRLDIGCGLLASVAFLHSCSLTHRDIKPENVLLNAEQQPVLIDFSFCKFIDPASLPTPPPNKRKKKHSTATALVEKNTGGLGTPTYVAPEVVAGVAYNHLADVWSLGVLFLELFESKRLDAEKDRAAIRLVADKRARLNSGKPVGRALAGMLDPEPTSRTEAKAALGLFVQQHPTFEGGTSMPQPIILPPLGKQKCSETAAWCAKLQFGNNMSWKAAAVYINRYVPKDVRHRQCPLFCAVLAGKMYETEEVDIEDVIDVFPNFDYVAYSTFEKDVFRASGFCLWVSPE
jgi:serine/threonine protein kinase